jgi:DNA-binding winged helix-turn-helix (wHTH) protein
MATDAFRFDDFVLHPGNRQLLRDGIPIDINGRYFDALVLMVRDAGALVSKDRFLEEVWQGVPVTDEALTQCIKTLRKILDDDAGSPRFIETVPKHGYRFVAVVECGEASDVQKIGMKSSGKSAYTPLQYMLLTGLAGSAGGAVAGAIGGLLYGFAAASQSASGGGALSALLVLLLLTTILATIGAAGVCFGMAIAERLWPDNIWVSVAGGAIGGMAIGAFARLLGLDAFNLLFGSAPSDFTGAAEGAALGLAAAMSAAIARHPWANGQGRTILLAATLGVLAGIGISLAGGRLLGGSLAALGQQFPQSDLRLDPLGILGGEGRFDPLSQTISAGLEGMLFCTCIALALAYVARRWAVED